MRKPAQIKNPRVLRLINLNFIIKNKESQISTVVSDTNKKPTSPLGTWMMLESNEANRFATKPIQFAKYAAR